jgi:Zn-dependent peptidase ImmA (M78 family)
MTKSTIESISAQRRLLQNPYAYIEDVETIAADRTNIERIVRDSNAPLAQGSKFSKQQIERRARQLQRQLWNQYSNEAGAQPGDPVDLLDPETAFQLIGYSVAIEEGLGQYRSGSTLIEVAGLIDRAKRRVHISRQFSPRVRRFTLAHELGHALLHPFANGIHRDRPMDGTWISREPQELEADHFAACFLMPRRLLRSRFAECFGVSEFLLTEEAAFALYGSTSEDLLKDGTARRDLARRLATAEQYNGRRFQSLADQFYVSSEAMAIRLEQLDLVAR